MKNSHDYRVELIVRDGDFTILDSATFSGRNAIVDAIYHLDTKYSPSGLAILKRFGIIDSANPIGVLIKKVL